MNVIANSRENDKPAMNYHDWLKKLKKEHKVAIPKLLALSVQNDPFHIGSPAHTKQAEWFAALWERLGYTKTKAHLRRGHYQYVSQELQNRRKLNGQEYKNSDNDWQYFQMASKYARYLGLVDPTLIVDHRNPEPDIFCAPQTAQNPSLTIPLPEWDMPFIDPDLLWNLDWRIPQPTVSGYDYDESLQPYALEIWVEKSAMNDILLPICQDFSVNLVTGIGFSSITGVIRLLKERLMRDPRPCRIFYISDFDPSGMLMPPATARQIEFWLARFALSHDVKLTRLLLTREQAMSYKLPRIPTKEGDTNAKKFEKLYGVGGTELDALEALHPGAFARIVTEAILPFHDPRLEYEVRGAQDAAQALSNRQWRERVRSYQDRLDDIKGEVREIARRYQQKLQALSKEMETELAPYQAQLDFLSHDIQNEREEFEREVCLPALPETNLHPEEDGWLFDSNREYLEQLPFYKKLDAA